MSDSSHQILGWRSWLQLYLLLFTNIRSLRDKPQWQDVRIGNDMTPAEREKEKLLRDQAKNLERQGKGKHTVRGPPWRRRVVKVTTETQ